MHSDIKLELEANFVNPREVERLRKANSFIVRPRSVIINKIILDAATISIQGSTYRMSVLGDVLLGRRPDLGAFLHRSSRLDEETARGEHISLLVSARRVKCFFRGGKLYLIHADLYPISRPWQYLPFSVSGIPLTSPLD